MNDDASDQSSGQQRPRGLLRDRFTREPYAVMERINASIDFDQRFVCSRHRGIAGAL